MKAIFFAFNSNRVQILWKGHKHLANYKWKIVPIFLAFSDYLDFSYALRQQNDVFKWKKIETYIFESFSKRITVFTDEFLKLNIVVKKKFSQFEFRTSRI